MIRPGRSTPRCLQVLLLLLCLVLPATGAAAAADNTPTDCRADQLKTARVTALAEFEHRGNDFSMVTSTMDISVPAGWAHASDLLLDAHSAAYRSALACLVGKPTDERNDFRDDEWRFKPVAVKADGQWVRVHYEASSWIQFSSVDAIGPWVVTVRKEEWQIALRPSVALQGADWDRVQVDLGGRGALAATPRPAFGEGGTRLSWQHKEPGGNPTVTFRPPTVQHWDFITTTTEEPWQVWETWGLYSASSALWYVVSGALLLIAARRLRRSLAGPMTAEESSALRYLRWWALLLMFLGVAVYLSDNLYRWLQRLGGWYHGYEPTVAVFVLAFLGPALCLFGSRSKRLVFSVSAIVVAVLGWYVAAEVFDFTVLPTADRWLSPPGWTVAAVACAALTAVCWIGVITAGQRILLISETRIPARVMVAAALAAAIATVLWAYLAFDRYWERISWLADPSSSDFQGLWVKSLDSWWTGFPANVLDMLMTLVSLLAPLPVLGVLRVCRVEQHEQGAFTPAPAEKFLLVVLFAITFAPPATYFGFSAYALTLLLCLCTAWGVLALGSSVSVLEQPFADNAPLGKTVSLTDRADVLRLARRFRELQARLGQLGTSNPGERAAERESIEAEIDRLDQALPSGVRPADLPFACGPMSTWWGNARRGAVNACLIGLPATGLLYWVYAVKGDSWTVNAENATGFVWLTVVILLWQIFWIVGGFFLGALWRDLPGRHGPTKALFVTLAFAVPTTIDFLIVRALGGSLPGLIGEVAAFGSVMTCTGLMMDLQTFQNERRYWPTNASLVAYVYQMRFASLAFFLAQLLALVTLWKTFADVSTSAPSR
ncbi:DUF6185 family protein [Streptomyces sp. NPDC058740]|uniref:DUF6185 family protein n=1 Tax=Streptomyces sp. NPDC058740 TaxID=3346619 RepID=UPI00368E05C5